VDCPTTTARLKRPYADSGVGVERPQTTRFHFFFIIHRDLSRAERTVTAMDEYSDN
jgi:hypothetical protein